MYHADGSYEIVDYPTAYINNPYRFSKRTLLTYGDVDNNGKVDASDALLSLKAGADAPIGTQQHIDRLAAAALRKGAGSFKRAFEPVLKMIEKADSLEQLRELMEDDAAVAELYAAMDVSEAEELLQKVMLYADLEGRVVEDG